MLKIHCPHCCEDREEDEFSPAGEAHIARPVDPEATSDESWGDYLFFRKNTRGPHHEMWYHEAGCRRYFNVTRDTVSYVISETYKIGERPAELASKELEREQ